MILRKLVCATATGLAGILVVMGCAAIAASTAETPGERFREAMEKIAAACESRKLARGEKCGEVTKLKPADPLATPEGRFAHSIKVPNPVPEDSGYKPSMTPQEYFNHLCKTEAGEFIYKTVENVEGIYQMRPRELATGNKYQEHLYALEDPFGYRDWEAKYPERFFVGPSMYQFFEVPVSSIPDPKGIGAQVKRYSGYDGKNPNTMIEEDVLDRKSRYGYLWRGVTRQHDREFGIAGGELILLDLRTNEVLGVRRGFIRSGNVRNLTGIWWLSGHVCSKDAGRLFYTSEFISRVLKPISSAKKEKQNAAK
jgi:hypothetical protein